MYSVVETPARRDPHFCPYRPGKPDLLSRIPIPSITASSRPLALNINGDGSTASGDGPVPLPTSTRRSYNDRKIAAGKTFRGALRS